MRLALGAALALVTASLAGAATAGIGISASPVRLTLNGASSSTIAVRNPSGRPLFVDVSRTGFARSLRGRPLIRSARQNVTWLRVHPRRLRLAPHGTATLHVAAVPSRHARPGDHPALVLLTTRPLGVRQVRVRLRVGIVVLLHVRGRIVRRLDVSSLTVRRRGVERFLELRLMNRGNVTEQIGGRRLQIVLRRGGRAVATLRSRRRELLPHSAGIAEFVYRGRLRGTVLAQVEALPPAVGGRTFHVRL